MKKIIRSLCWFAETPEITGILDRLNEIEDELIEHGYLIQTKRVCFSKARIDELHRWQNADSLYLSVGMLDFESLTEQLADFLHAGNVSLNLDLTGGVSANHVDVLLQIIRDAPAKTFNFAYTFHNRPSSPFFPSATFEHPGFAIGLQPTDLSEGYTDLTGWLSAMEAVWLEICDNLDGNEHFLGIDASIAPLFRGDSSLVHFVKTIHGNFSKAVTTDFFIKITAFLSSHNPKPVGLCGLMLPCLEDFELAEEYEAGRFSIERNAFLALHSGLGVDTYPIGIDENPERILQVLCLLQKLSAKYEKPLSARFVSDGKTKIGAISDFQNPYLKDVMIRPL
ncbi:DUF711 family protein [Thermodesulfobacteriota bacterium]